MNEATSFIRKAYEKNKNGVESAFSAAETFQKQAETITLRLLNESPLVPEPTKKIVQSGFETSRQSRETLKGQMEKSQKAFEELLDAVSL